MLEIHDAFNNFLQHCNSKALLFHSAFLMTQFSVICYNWKNMVLAICTFLDNMLSLHFNSLSGSFIGFLPICRCPFHGYRYYHVNLALQFLLCLPHFHLSSTYLTLLIFLPTILMPISVSSGRHF